MVSYYEQQTYRDLFRWHDLKEESLCKRIESAIQKYDEALSAAERVWGVDRLPYLVDADLRQRWQRGVEKLNEGIRNRDVQSVERLVDNMLKGLGKLIAAAREAGHAPLQADVWEARLKDGRVLRLVRSSSAVADQTDERDVVVWSLEEVARVVEANSSVNRVKQVFPGAIVTSVKPRPALLSGNRAKAVIHPPDVKGSS